MVKVVGIRVKEEKIIPSMVLAMVAVKKKKLLNAAQQQGGSSSMQSLLQGAEPLIIRALECRLDDLMTN